MEGLSATEQADLARLAGIMIPADAGLGAPGGDDPAILADLLASLGRDGPAIAAALRTLAAAADGPFTALPAPAAEALAMRLLAQPDADFLALGRVLLGAYYRDDRVLRRIGREPRAPFPKGHELPAGDWSLLEVVKQRAPFWRDDRRA
jgi:hypothetical protein